jgi:hypothetical protein
LTITEKEQSKRHAQEDKKLEQEDRRIDLEEKEINTKRWQIVAGFLGICSV